MGRCGLSILLVETVQNRKPLSLGRRRVGRKNSYRGQAISADQVMLNSIPEQSGIACDPNSLHQIVLVERHGSRLEV
jgi:hypothetical protein